MVAGNVSIKQEVEDLVEAEMGKLIDNREMSRLIIKKN
jgi:hypothetical protein